jgi:sirohydrochlorin cobaltochelatase
LLFVAHGTPLVAANWPVQQVLTQVQQRMGYGPALIGYLECNQPSIATAFAQLVERGIGQITVLPYFLHQGRHVGKDLPSLFDRLRQSHPQVAVRIAHHLGYDPLLVDVVAERMRETGINARQDAKQCTLTYQA